MSGNYSGLKVCTNGFHLENENIPCLHTWDLDEKEKTNWHCQPRIHTVFAS